MLRISQTCFTDTLRCLTRAGTAEHKMTHPTTTHTGTTGTAVTGTHTHAHTGGGVGAKAAMAEHQVRAAIKLTYGTLSSVQNVQSWFCVCVQVASHIPGTAEHKVMTTPKCIHVPAASLSSTDFQLIVCDEQATHPTSTGGTIANIKSHIPGEGAASRQHCSRRCI